MSEPEMQVLLEPLGRGSRQVRRRGVELGWFAGSFVLWNPIERHLLEVSPIAAAIWTDLHGQRFDAILDDLLADAEIVAEDAAAVDADAIERELVALFRFLRSAGMVEDDDGSDVPREVVSVLVAEATLELDAMEIEPIDGRTQVVIGTSGAPTGRRLVLRPEDLSAATFVVIDPETPATRDLGELEVLTHVMRAAHAPLSIVVRDARGMCGRIMPGPPSTDGPSTG